MVDTAQHTTTPSFHSTLASASRQYLGELGLVVTFFVLTVTLANLLYRMFAFPLLPVFEVTFEAFRTVCHYLMNILVFSWATYLLESVLYGFIRFLSVILPIVPRWPEIVIPPWALDLVLVSLALTRVFQSTDVIVPRADRAQAEGEMTTESWKKIERAEGPFWGPIHRFVDRLNARIWKCIDFLQRLLTLSLGTSSAIARLVRGLLITVAGSLLFWGYVRLLGYAINVWKARDLQSPIMICRRRFFRYFALNLTGALAACAIFFVVNGWAVDYTMPDRPAVTGPVEGTHRS